jgi:hypothetical protein
MTLHDRAHPSPARGVLAAGGRRGFTIRGKGSERGTMTNAMRVGLTVAAVLAMMVAMVDMAGGRARRAAAGAIHDSP